ncbi:MAG: hypothetical protein ACOY5F_03370 [Pseudomonadota bacterium]
MKFLLIGLVLLLAACKPYSYPIAGPDPADPSVRVAPVRYQYALGSYLSQRPVSPANWREQNQRVTPQQQ